MNDSKNVINYEKKGKHRSLTIHGVKMEPFLQDAFLVPIKTLEKLSRKELKQVPEIAIVFDPESDDCIEYPGLSKFSELRISVLNNPDDNSMAISVVVLDPYDIEVLDLHSQYQLKFADVVSRYDFVSLWMHPQSDVETIVKSTNYWNDYEKRTGREMEYSPVGYIGFHLFGTAETYKELIGWLSDFLIEVDKQVREEIVI